MSNSLENGNKETMPCKHTINPAPQAQWPNKPQNKF